MTEWLHSQVWYLDNYKLHLQTLHFITSQPVVFATQALEVSRYKSPVKRKIVSLFSVSEGGERTRLRLRARLGWRTLLIGHSDNLW